MSAGGASAAAAAAINPPSAIYTLTAEPKFTLPAT